MTRLNKSRFKRWLEKLVRKKTDRSSSALSDFLSFSCLHGLSIKTLATTGYHFPIFCPTKSSQHTIERRGTAAGNYPRVSMFKVRSNHTLNSADVVRVKKTIKGNNELDASSNHTRGSRTYKSKTAKGKNELDMSSSNHSRGTTKSTKKKVHRVSIGVLLEQHNESSRSFTTPPMDEISVSSDMSGRSNGTEITMTSRGSRVSTVSKLPRNLGRAGSTRTFGRESSYRSVHSSHSSTCGSMLQDTNAALDHNHI
eukprot:scaffold12713_cov146-Amphora_coffeaeformis.AAC.1